MKSYFIITAINAGLPNRNRVGKTSGYLFDGDGNMIGDIIVSGRNSPYYRDTTLIRGDDKLYSIQSHVEAQVAGIMRDNNISNATLVINNHPCPGIVGCNNLLSSMLPQRANLRVIVPDGFDPRGAFDEGFTGQ